MGFQTHESAGRGAELRKSCSDFEVRGLPVRGRRCASGQSMSLLVKMKGAHETLPRRVSVGVEELEKSEKLCFLNFCPSFQIRKPFDSSSYSLRGGESFRTVRSC